MNIRDYLHLYIGSDYQWQDADGEWRRPQPFTPYQFNDVMSHWIPARLILRQLSSMTDDEIKHVGSLICHRTEICQCEIKRYGNTVGAYYNSEEFISGQYFSVYTEKDNHPGHIECGWFERPTSPNSKDRKKPRLWKRGSYHEVTIYLIKQGFDIFGLINAGLAVEKK